MTVCGLLGLVLGACGSDPTQPASLPQATIAPGEFGPTATPPFPARQLSPSATATSNAPRVSGTSPPAPPPPPLFPTSTLAPVPTAFNFTATAAAPELQLTPGAAPTGQLAFVQAGNLWLIDDNGGNRRQLTESGDIGADSLLSWNLSRDRLAYLSQAGELWLLDLQGKRNLVFSPGRTSRSPGAVKLPPVSPPANATPRPAPRAGLFLKDLKWSPDGRYLAFTYYAGEVGPVAGGEVWLADLVGDKVNLIRVGEGFGPDWSGDGRSLAYLSRGEIKQGSTRPTPGPALTPPGTSLLPVTPTKSAEGQDGELAVAQNQSQTQTLTPPVSTPPVTKTAAPGPAPTNTPFIIRAGGTTPPETPGSPTVAASPTATLDIVALPSATPTPTYPPVYLGTYVTNKVLVYNPITRKTTTITESDRLPEAFIDTEGTPRSYIPSPLQSIWWSPDGRYLAFSDRLSVVGVVASSSGNPVIWTGSPQNYAVYELEWLPRSDGAFFRVGNPYSDDSMRLNLATFNGGAPGVAGLSGDVSNRGLLRLSLLPGNQVSCPTLSPGGNFFSYYDGAVVVIARTDGTIFSTYSDSECPAWSPFGRGFASVRKNSDRSLTLTSLDSVQTRTLLSARAVERVFWLRADPSYLGGQPTVPGALSPPPTSLTPRP